MAYDVVALEKLIEQFQKMPSIGRKTAQRMAFHVLDLSEDEAKEFADAIINAHTKIHRCALCHNLTENELCPICEGASRDKTTVCVVEEPKDVLAMERTREFSGFSLIVVFLTLTKTYKHFCFSSFVEIN